MGGQVDRLSYRRTEMRYADSGGKWETRVSWLGERNSIGQEGSRERIPTLPMLLLTISSKLLFAYKIKLVTAEWKHTYCMYVRRWTMPVKIWRYMKIALPSGSWYFWLFAYSIVFSNPQLGWTKLYFILSFKYGIAVS